MHVKDRILRILQESKEIRLHDLARQTGASRQMVHRAVRKLVESGALSRIGSAPKTRYTLAVQQKPMGRKPVFDKRIFWDADFENLDYQRNARAIIERVFERGDVEDIRNCRRYYGDEKVTDVLLKAKFLPQTTMYLASAVINKPISDFKCFTLRQSNPGHYPY